MKRARVCVEWVDTDVPICCAQARMLGYPHSRGEMEMTSQSSRQPTGGSHLSTRTLHGDRSKRATPAPPALHACCSPASACTCTLGFPQPLQSANTQYKHTTPRLSEVWLGLAAAPPTVLPSSKGTLPSSSFSQLSHARPVRSGRGCCPAWTGAAECASHWPARAAAAPAAPRCATAAAAMPPPAVSLHEQQAHAL